MSNPNEILNEEVVSAADLNSIDALLDDFDFEAEQVEAIAEDPDAIEELDIEGELDEDALRSLDADIQRTEVYAEQESEIADVSTATPDPKVKKVRGTRPNAQPRAPRAARTDLALMDSALFVLEGDVASMSDEDKDAAKAATLAMRPTQVKIAEKFDNMFQQLNAGKLPSTYVLQAFKLLEQKQTLGMSEIIASFVASGYVKGTAASQAGQIMHLFDTLKIARRAKSVIELNKDSVIVQRLRDVIAASTSA